MGFRLGVLVHNPPPLRLLCVCRIRQSISSMNVERNLIEKLSADDFHYPNALISLEDMCKYFNVHTFFRFMFNQCLFCKG